MDEQYQGLSAYLSVVFCLNSKYIKSNAYKTYKFTKPLPKYVCKVYAYLWQKYG